MSDQDQMQHHPVVGMHKSDIIIAIETAPVSELAAIDAGLAAIGYGADGVLRQRIQARLTPTEE